jgi:hypothetical protein
VTLLLFVLSAASRSEAGAAQEKRTQRRSYRRRDELARPPERQRASERAPLTAQREAQRTAERHLSRQCGRQGNAPRCPDCPSVCPLREEVSGGGGTCPVDGTRKALSPLCSPAEAPQVWVGLAPSASGRGNRQPPPEEPPPSKRAEHPGQPPTAREAQAQREEKTTDRRERGARASLLATFLLAQCPVSAVC